MHFIIISLGKYSTVIILLLCSTISYAQLEASKWYFNNKVGVDFSTGLPTVINSSEMQALEGCASISDAEGNILFYTNGQQIWNKNNEIMQGGANMPGHYSSTQSALIVPKPSNDQIYYVFFVDRPSPSNSSTYPNPNPTPDQANPAPDILNELLIDDGLNNGLNYVTVDMNADNGNGAVIGGIQHLVTYDENDAYEKSFKCSEKLTGIRNPSDGSIWIVTFFIDTFYAFKVDNNGVNVSPVVSQSPFSISPFNYITGAIGCMKLSPDAKKLVVANYAESVGIEKLFGSLYLFDFDNQTGEINNPELLLDDITPYGVEFSPDGKKLYASEQKSSFLGSTYNIYQYDVSSSSPVASSQELVTSGFGTCGSLQLAINGKIYYLNSEIGALSCVENPNEDASILATTQNALSFPNHTIASNFTTGLPNYLQSYFYGLITYDNTCYGEETFFSLDNLENVLSIDWDFGDGQIASGTEINHSFDASGIYRVKAEVTTLNGNIKNLITNVRISEPIIAYPISDVYGCDNNADGFVDDLDVDFLIAQAKGTQINAKVAFFDQQGNSLPSDFTNTVPYEQTINARVFNKQNPSCFEETNFKIHTITGAQANEVVDIITCSEEGDGYKDFDTSGIEETLLGGQSNMNVQYFDSNGDELPSPLPNPYRNKVKYNELITAQVINTETGCSDETSFRLIVRAKPEMPEIGNLEACLENEKGFAIFDTSEVTERLNQDSENVISFYNEKDNNITNEFQNSYTNTVPYEEEIRVKVSRKNNPDCYSERTFKLIAHICPDKALVFFPKFFTPNQDSYNPTWQASPAIRNQISDIHIFDRYGKLLITISPREYWDGTYHGKAMPSTEYWFSTILDQSYQIKGHFSLIR